MEYAGFAWFCLVFLLLVRLLVRLIHVTERNEGSLHGSFGHIGHYHPPHFWG